MNRDTVVAFNNPNPSSPEGQASLPPLDDVHVDDLNPQRRTVDQESRPKKRMSKKVLLVALIAGVLSAVGYKIYTSQSGESLTNLWPTSTSSSPVKPDAMTLLTQRVTQIETAQAVVESRVSAIQNTVTSVQHAIENAVTSEQITTLEAQLDNGRAQLDARLAKLEERQRQRIKAATKQAAAPVAAIPTLPFQVLSIDLWNDRPYVAVSTSGVTELLAVGDHRAGWAVLDINRSTGQATFVNNKDGTTLKRLAQDGST